MDKIFRQISVNDRLPKNNGGIIAICSPEDGLQQLYFKDGEFLDPMDDLPMNATAWLEEVELPTYSEIDWKYPLNANQTHKTTLNVGCRTGAKWVIDRLKGENR